MPEIATIDDFAAMIRTDIAAYMRTLSPNAPNEVLSVRLEVTGSHTSVIFAQDAPAGQPWLQLSFVTGEGKR